ncbi:MAG TPA: hypothetical protein VFR55_05765, partial [Dehalococcoidia bacterium]|nr:hypothetical protein [Dehalococcoidia bacterium]
QVLAVERASTRYWQQALTELQSRRVYSAYDYARRACELHRSPDSVKALALVSLVLRRFDDALSLWQEYRVASLSDG